MSVDMSVVHMHINFMWKSEGNALVYTFCDSSSPDCCLSVCFCFLTWPLLLAVVSSVFLWRTRLVGSVGESSTA